MFLRAYCTPNTPLVLVLEDLHYADRCSLDLLGNLISDEETEGLIMIGTVDVCAIDESKSYLSAKLRELEDKVHVKINTVDSESLGPELFRNYLSLALNSDMEKVVDLYKIAIQKIGGEAICLLELMNWLLESNLLLFDSQQRSWTWKESQIVSQTTDRYS